MAGVLLSTPQVDSKSGILTLFGPQMQDTRSYTFDVGDKPYLLVAYNLSPGQAIGIYNVAQVDGTTRESLFSYNGNTLTLTANAPTCVVAFTGTYRAVLNTPVGNVVLKAYPQQAVNLPVSPVQSDIVNSIALTAGVFSPIIQILDKVFTVKAYDLVGGDTVDIFCAYEGFNAYIATLTAAQTTHPLDKTGDYRLLASKNCVVTIRPNHVDFQNPYVNKGDKGDPGPIGPSASAYTHTQSTPSATWTINHNLGYRPSVELLTVGGVEFDASVVHTSINQTVVEIAMPIAGSARLN
jgi:hypothetical protein